MPGTKHNSRVLQWTGLALSLCLLAGSLPLNTAFAGDSGVLTGDVRVTVDPANIRESLPVPGGSRKVTMALHDVDLQDAFRALSSKGGFNVLLDDSVVGNISVDLNNVTIQDALETLKSYGNLVYQVQGRNLMVTSATSDVGKAFKNSTTKVFPLHNANAKVVADFLNNTVFADRNNQSQGSSSGAGSSPGATGAMGGAMGGMGGSSGGGGMGSGGATGNAPRPVMPDYNTNSIIVVGDPVDIKVVEEHLMALDQPRQMKTWRLSQANALDVTSALYSSLFNEGMPGLSMTNTSSSSSSSSSTGPVGMNPAPLRVIAESVQDGSGTSQSSQGGGNSGGSSGTTSVVNDLTLRTRVQATQTIQISPTGPIIMPDTRMNTVTMLGTAEQIAMAESLVSLLDRKLPQLVLETSLLEMTEDVANQFGFSSGSSGRGFSTGGNNVTGTPFTNAIGAVNGNAGENILRLTTDSIRTIPEAFYQINALISKNKIKRLANPTIITSSDNEAAVSIVDEILRSVTVTQGSFGGATSKTFNIGEAGIVLNILPKVGANKAISMRVRPVVTSVLSTTNDINGNQVTLLSKRESLAQNVQVKDGETFVLGGLIHSTNAQSVLSSPVLSQLPIVGALARNSNSNKHRTELVIMITPHIVTDESQLSRTAPSSPNNGIQPATLSSNGRSVGNGMVPVSLSGASNSASTALPDMLPVQPFNSVTNSEDTADHDQAQPMRRPSGSLMPSDMIAPPKPAKQKTSSLPGNSSNAPTFMPASATSAGNSDLSDDKIQAIMNKFKSE